MHKGIKWTVLTVTVLIVSVALGFAAVLFVFNNIGDGRYELSQVKSNGVAYDSNTSGWQEFVDDGYLFVVSGSDITIYKDNEPRNGLHKLSNGLFGERYIEVSYFGVGGWIKYDGSQDVNFESWSSQNHQITVRIRQANTQNVQEWVYKRV